MTRTSDPSPHSASTRVVVSGAPVIALSGHPKVTETFAPMARGECVIDPAGATPHQLAAAVIVRPIATPGED